MRRYFGPGLIFMWVISIAIGTRYVFGEPQDFGPNQHLEYLRLFLPFSALVSAVVIVYFRRFFVPSRSTMAALIFFVGSAAVGTLTASRPDLALFWLLLASIYLTAGYLIGRATQHIIELRGVLLTWFSITSVAVAIIGILQFALGHTLGLSLLGEISANDQTLGVAKVIFHGDKLLRPLGTLLHANIFGGLLTLGLAATMALALTKRSSGFFVRFSMGIILLGIFLSFSRSTWIAAALVIVFYLFFGLGKVLFAPITALCVGLLIWFPIFSSRFQIGEQSAQISIRNSLAEFSLDAIKSHPLFGIGFHNFVVQRFSYDLQPYEIQPVHNTFLLLAAELGLVSVGLLIIAAVYYFVREIRAGRIVALASLLPLLPIFLLDHYLVSIFQGLGILAGFVALHLSIRTVPRGTKVT